MISLADSERIQNALDQYAAANKGYVIRANSPDVLKICSLDIVEADIQLRRLWKRHSTDCDIVGENPLTIKIYGTFSATAAERIQKDRFLERKEWKNKRQSDSRQWDSMIFARPEK